MFQRGVRLLVTVLAALALALPMTAQADTVKDSKNVIKASMDLLNPATLNGKQLKPGNYSVTVDGSKVTLARDGKVVAEAQVQWKDAQSKSRYSAIVTDGAQITEIHFNGKVQYIQISQ